MKKYIISLVTLFLIVPQIVLAAWWNPFTWFDNWGRKENEIETLKARIQELEKIQETSDSSQTKETYPISAPVSVNIPVTKITQTKVESSNTETTTQSKVMLQIENVESVVDGGAATVTWTTTLPSKSRLIFDNGEGRVFESENGLGTSHKIDTVGLRESEEYDFKITATTEDKGQDDDYYGILYAKKKYTALFGHNKNGCRVIIIEDTAGHLAVEKSIKLRPSQVGTDTVVVRPVISAVTNSSGEVKYCEIANTFRITGEELAITISTQTSQE